MNVKNILFFCCMLGSPVALAADNKSTSYPYISGDSFRAIADYIIDDRASTCDPKKFKPNAIIFVKTDFLEKFFLQYHPFIPHRYILITHNSDDPVPGLFADYLNDPKLIAWFGQNVIDFHEKLIPIPIGIANPHWRHGKIKTLDDVLKKISDKNDVMKKQYNKLLYMNFSIATNFSIRNYVYKLFSEKKYCYKTSIKPWDEYLSEMAHYCFVLSPEGNGPDCVRTWEALLVGCIPIVQSSSLDVLYKDLPVLIIDNWEDITEEFLIRAYTEMQTKSYNMQKIYVQYWYDLIRSYIPKK